MTGPRRPPEDAEPPAVDLREVVVQYRDDIYRYARWLTRSAADAEDLAQTAVVRALERGVVLRDPEKAKWYLLRIVRNLATDHARARARVSVEPRAFVPDVISRDNQPEEVVLRADELAIPSAAMALLPAHHQEILRLRFVEGLAYATVARRLDVTEQAARQRVYRAVQALRAVVASRTFRSA